jgi:hypothetical protein
MIYDETLCTDFHKFLVAVLIGYGKSLRALYTKATNDDPLSSGLLADSGRI